MVHVALWILAVAVVLWAVGTALSILGELAVGIGEAWDKWREDRELRRQPVGRPR